MSKLIYVPEYFDEQVSTNQKRQNDSAFIDYYQFKKYSEIFGFLNNHDRDVLLSMFVNEKTQNDISSIFGFSQPKFSYDKSKISKRIVFICFIHENIEKYAHFLEHEAKDAYSEEMKLIMTSMLYTTSFSRTAELTGLSYASIRTKFKNLLVDLKKKYPQIYEIFKTINDNLNMVRRINKGDKFLQKN